MRIRSLDNPKDQLSVMEDDQGDIYVSIWHEGETYRDSGVYCVRIGQGNSGGPDIPRMLHQKLHEVAHEFDRFKDIQWESEAARIGDREDELKWLDFQISGAEMMLRECGNNLLMRKSAENHLADLREQREKLTSKNI